MNELMRRMLFLPEQASTSRREVDHLHFFVIIGHDARRVGVGG